MKVTTRDLFNFDNYPMSYDRWLKSAAIKDGDLPESHDDYEAVLQAKRNGTLEGEQVKHERANDEVDCG